MSSTQTNVEAIDLIFGGKIAGLAALYAPRGISAKVGFHIARQLARAVTWQSDVHVAASDYDDAELRDQFGSDPDVRWSTIDHGFRDLAEVVERTSEGFVILDSIDALEMLSNISRVSGPQYRELRSIRAMARERGTMVLGCGTWDFDHKRPVGTSLWPRLVRDYYVLHPFSAVHGEYGVESRAASASSDASRSEVRMWIDPCTVTRMPIDPSPESHAYLKVTFQKRP
ncbi:hypothetical protein HH308_18885 [Gordonia sp. TBRC 11910]|uniref:Uncharacterized protein n=1 Tax=Gordonia asplenii TaxID=2725283 RepID=A0A848L3W1_9ACTN|nr:hypothetical protein [Gordonia asplenii]NMO03283.1 hypothetical protein [Gordonia asplenii]